MEREISVTAATPLPLHKYEAPEVGEPKVMKLV